MTNDPMSGLYHTDLYAIADQLTEMAKQDNPRADIVSLLLNFKNAWIANELANYARRLESLSSSATASAKHYAEISRKFRNEGVKNDHR